MTTERKITDALATALAEMCEARPVCSVAVAVDHDGVTLRRDRPTGPWLAVVQGGGDHEAIACRLAAGWNYLPLLLAGREGAMANSRSYEYIRRAYGVAPVPGHRFRWNGHEGVILRPSQGREHYLRVRFDDRPSWSWAYLHPTDGVEYLGRAATPCTLR